MGRYPASATYSTLFSAALPLASWVETHGRYPTWRECSARNGLALAETYVLWFQASGLGAVFASMQALLGGSASSALAVPETPSPAMKPCLNDRCRAMIRDEGPHIRFCRDCRRARLFTRHGADLCEETLAIRRTDLRRYGYGRAGWDGYWDDDDLQEVPTSHSAPRVNNH